MTILRPSQDIITGGWTSTDASLSAAIDETTASDTDYIATSAAGDIARVSLGTYADAAPSIILKRDVWTSQPQVPAELNPDYNFIGYWPLNSVYPSTKDSKNIRPLTANGTQGTLVTSRGTAKLFNGSSTYYNNTTSISLTGTVIASLIATKTTGTSSNRRIISFGSGTGNAVMVTCDGTGYEGYHLVSKTGSAGFKGLAADGVSTHIVGIFVNGVAAEFYLNGVLQTSTEAYGIWGDSAYTGVLIGTRDILTTFYSGGISDVAIINGSVQQGRDIAKNPYQIFRKQPKPIFITPPRGTHTLKYRAASPEADRGLIARVLELGQPPALILKRAVWTSQPQTGGVQIDWSNPITSGLVFADAANGVYLSGSLKRITPMGKGLGEAFVTKSPKITSGVANSTLIQLQYFTAVPAWNSDAVYYSDTSTLYPNDYGLRLATPQVYGRVFLGARNSLGNIRGLAHDLLSGSLSAGDAFFVAATVDNNLLITKYGKKSNGVLVFATDTDFQGYTFPTPTTGNITFGAYNATYEPGTNILLTARWNRALSAQEINSLSATPWQIFRKQPKPIFIDAPKLIASQTKTSAELSSTALVLKRDIWTSQPQSAVEIDPRFTYVVTANGVIKDEASTNVTHCATVGGIAKRIASGGKISSSAITIPDFYGTFIFAFIPSLNAASGSNIWASRATIGNNTGIFTLNSSGQLRLDSYGAWSSNYTASVCSAGKLCYLVVRCRKSTIIAFDAYSNGTHRGLISTVSYSLPNTPSGWTIGYDPYYGTHTMGFLMWAWTPLNLSDAECLSLSANPWQIFKKQPKPLYFDLGPSEYNLTLSSEETSSITDNSELALEVEST